MNLTKVTLDTNVDFGSESFKDFCHSIWGNSKSTRNMSSSFYEYVSSQPQSANLPRAICSVRQNKRIVAMICLFYNQYEKLQIATPCNFYHRRDISSRLPGILLTRFWKKNCDIQLSLSPRQAIASQYKKARWTAIPMFRVRKLQKLRAVLRLYQGQYLRLISLFLNYSKLKIQQSFRKKVHTLDHMSIIKISCFDDSFLTFFSKLKKEIQFFNRTPALLNWRYFRFKHQAYSTSVYKVMTKDSLVGYFSIIENNRFIRIGEIFGLRKSLKSVCQALDHTITNQFSKYDYVQFSTNSKLIVYMLKFFGFNNIELFFAYFRVNCKKEGNLHFLRTNDFILVSGDGDVYGI